MFQDAEAYWHKLVKRCLTSIRDVRICPSDKPDCINVRVKVYGSFAPSIFDNVPANIVLMLDQEEIRIGGVLHEIKTEHPQGLDHMYEFVGCAAGWIAQSLRFEDNGGYSNAKSLTVRFKHEAVTFKNPFFRISRSQ